MSQLFGQLLAALGAATAVGPSDLTAFWPMVGHNYDRGLLVIGRAVNGWMDHITAEALSDPRARAALVAAVRRMAEGDGGCPMRRVTERWSPGDGEYSTATSAFWRHIRGVLSAVEPDSRDDPLWSSRIAWSNLAKLAPAGGGNPGGALLEVQRRVGPRLILGEVIELAPRRVLVLTGRWWFEPFAERVGLDLDWRERLVQGIVRQPGRTWVIAGHPQGKPRAMLDEVVDAFQPRRVVTWSQG